MGLPLNAWYARLVKAPAYDSQRIETFAVEDFGYVIRFSRSSDSRMDVSIVA